MIYWRRLYDWQATGVWDRLHELLLSTRRAADQIDFLQAAVDSSSIRALGRPKNGTKPDRSREPLVRHRHLSQCPPLVSILTGASVHDVTQLLPLIDAIPAIPGLRGHPHPPTAETVCCLPDRGYDSERHRQALCNRGIEPMIARHRAECGSDLGECRWIFECTHAWLHRFRRIRFERRADIHGAFLTRLLRDLLEYLPAGRARFCETVKWPWVRVRASSWSAPAAAAVICLRFGKTC